MERFHYELEIRLPSCPRVSQSNRMRYIEPDYRKGQYDFRSMLIEKYGRFTPIEPTKRIPAAPSKGREEQPPYRNVVINYLVMLAGNTPVNEDNIGKFIFDSLAPISAKAPTKKDIELDWSPLFRNDRQVIGGNHLVVDNWPFNHLQLEVVRLDSPEELAPLIDGWRGVCLASTP